jgi:hypothetical protein
MGALFQFVHDPEAGEPSLAGLAARYDLDDTALDHDYGVVLIDERAGLWVAMVDDAAASGLQEALSAEDVARGAGVFANPRIDPMDDRP